MIFSNLNGGQSDLQRRSTEVDVARCFELSCTSGPDATSQTKFDVCTAINSKEVDVARCFELS